MDLAQGLSSAMEPPEGFNRIGVLGQMIGLPGNFVLAPNLAKEDDPVKMQTLPRYDTEGARFAYRAFLQIAQVVPNNWRFFLPGAGGISQDVIAIAGMGAVPIAILAGGGPYANVADPYSALMRQRWASNGVVAFGKNVADVLPNLRMIVSQTVEGTRSFNVAGYQLEVNPEAKLIGTPEEKQE